MPGKGLEFLGAIGRGLKAVAKQNPQSFAVQTPNAASTDILTRYAPYPLKMDVPPGGSVHTLSAPSLHRLDQATGKTLSQEPSFMFDVEKMGRQSGPYTVGPTLPLGMPNEDPLSVRTIAGINAMNAKAAEDPHFVPRGYYTIWDYLSQQNAYDRNPYGGLTLVNMMRKPAYLQSYLLRKGQVQPQVEMHPNMLKAAEVPNSPRDAEGNELRESSPWIYPELGHDEARYPGLSVLRNFMESHQRPEEREAGSLMGSYIRGWEQLDHDQQVGALGLSEAGAMSNLLSRMGREGAYEKAQWGLLPEWEDTLGMQLGRSAKDTLYGYSTGPTIRRRAMLTDWLYRNPGAELDASKPDAQDFTKNLFYSKGGTVHNPALAGIGKVKTLQHLRSTGSNVMRLAGGGRVKAALQALKGLGPKLSDAKLPVPFDEGRRNFLRQSSALAGRTLLDGVAPGASPMLAELAAKAATSAPNPTSFHEAVALGAPAFYKELAEWMGGSAEDRETLLGDLELILSGEAHPALSSAEDVGSLAEDAQTQYDEVLGMMQRHLSPEIMSRDRNRPRYQEWEPYDVYDELRNLLPEGKAKGGRIKAALNRIHMAGPKFRPVELYAPIDEQAQLLGRSAYRDPQEAARAGLSSSPNTAVAPVLLRRTPGGSGLFNRLPEEGPVELNDPEGYKLGFKKGGLACACGGHK